jgi:hypothetical protein
MFCWRRSISILMIFSLMWLSGCHSTHAQSAPSHPSADQAQAPTPPVAKHPPRDSSLSVYNNPTYGVSFRYPRNFALRDGFEPGSTEQLERLTGQQPGAVPVAAISIPNDAYPNTTFRNGTLQLVVNSAVTPETCRSFAAPLDEAYTSGSTFAQGITFNWRQRGSAAMGTGYLNRDYAGFSNGACYEFFLEIITGSNPEADPRIKDADEVKIMRQLGKIISSLQIHTHASAAVPKPLPVVHSFTIESIPHAHLQNVVRVSWDISGAADNEVFLRVNCPGPILADLNPLPDAALSETQPAQASPTAPPSLEEVPDRYSRKTFFRLESFFACGSFTPIPPRSGTFRLQIETHSAEPVSFTLFVFGFDYLTRSIR